MVVGLLEFFLQALNTALELFDNFDFGVNILLRLILDFPGSCSVMQGAYGFTQIFLSW